MKHIRIFEEFKHGSLTEDQIGWLDDVVKGTWKVNREGKVDVRGDVLCLNHSHMKKIPVVFGKVSGFFNLGKCTQLESLEGSPREVGQYFDCRHCSSLKTLEGSPLIVRHSFYCSGCTSLVSLIGSPRNVSEYFRCSGCTSLKTLKGAPLKVGEEFHIFDTPLVPRKEKELLKSDKDLFLQWANSAQPIDQFMHQKRGSLKGREFGF